MFGFLKTGYQKIKNALAKTGALLRQKLTLLFKDPWTEETFEKLEQALYEADLGSACSLELAESARRHWRKHPQASPEELLDFLKKEARALLAVPPRAAPSPSTPPPLIYLIVGVNGSGKTTSLAKLAALLKREGKRPLIAAGDTFRAAAIEQLEAWAQKLDLPLIKSTPGADPSSVAFDAIQAAKARGNDTVLIDTAGRLQNKTDLMKELEKIRRVIDKLHPGAPQETLLVLDATSGQNALDQAEVFHSFTPLTGILLTKLDGSAKGGIALSIYQKLGIPIRYVGVGEQADDLMPFDPDAYVDGLFG